MQLLCRLPTVNIYRRAPRVSRVPTTLLLRRPQRQYQLDCRSSRDAEPGGQSIHVVARLVAERQRVEAAIPTGVWIGEGICPAFVARDAFAESAGGRLHPISG